MTTAAMLQKIQTVLAADTDLHDYCVNQLGGAPTLQIDFDEQQELEISCYPFIGILTITHDGAISQHSNIYTVRMLAAVRNSTLNSSRSSTGATLRSYPGRLQAETLRELAITALYRGQLGKITVNSDDMSHTYHPKFYSPFTLTIEERI